MKSEDPKSEIRGAQIGEPWMDEIKVVEAGYPVLRRGRWLVKDTILDRRALLRMLAALDGMGTGDMDA